MACFGLEKNKADTQIGKLSGGEKSRLLLSLITIEKPNILILDEPTNHLDITSRRALIEALNDYDGAVILVTHDFHILESVCDRLLLVEGGTVKSYDGDLEDYKNYVLHSSRSSADEGSQEGEDNRKEKRKNAAKLRAQTAPLRNKIKAIERKLEVLSSQKENLENRLIRGYDSSVSIELAFVNKEISDAEKEWEQLSEELESIMNS